MAVAMTLLVVTLGYLFCKERIFSFNPLTLLVLALWALALASAVVSEIPFISLTYFFFFSAFPITYLIFQRADGERVLPFVRWMIAALSISSLVQFYFMPQMLKFGGAHWPLEDNNSLAIILAVGALMFLGESLRGKRFAKYDVAAAVICFAGVMTTGAVAVFLSFFLVMAVFVCLLKPDSYKSVFIFMAGVIVLMAVMTNSGLGFYHFFGQGVHNVGDFLEIDTNSENRISGGRYMIWASAIEIIKLHPLIGTGIGTFFLYYPEFRNMNEGSAGYMVHNDLIQMTSEMGFLAPLIAISMIFFVLIRVWHVLRMKMDKNERLDVLIPFAAFGLLVGYSLVNFNFYVFPTLMMIGLFLSILNTKFARREISLPQKNIVREAFAVLVVVIFLVPLWACSLSEYHTNQAMKALEREDVQAFSDHLNMAGQWGRGANGRAILQGAKFAALVNQEDRALELLGKAQAANPRLVGIYIERADILSRRENLEAALAEAQAALRLDVGSTPARMKVADVLEQMGKDDEAYFVLAAGLKGVMRLRDPRDYYHRLAALSLQRADIEVNKEVLKRLQKTQ